MPPLVRGAPRPREALGDRSVRRWVFEPRSHHPDFKATTPPAPKRQPFGWILTVASLWSDEHFLMYAGVDGLVLVYFLRYAMEQCLFAGVVGCLVLVPAYHTGRGLYSSQAVDDDPPRTFSFSLTTVQNIRCRFDDALYDADLPLFPQCENGHSNWRFIAVVCCAWLFTIRALSKLSETSQRFVHVRHWYLTSGLRAARPLRAQHAHTIQVENVPRDARSAVALRRAFDALLGPGSVHSTSIMVAGLDELNRLCARRDRAFDALEDARSRRAKMASMRETRLKREYEDRRLRRRRDAPRRCAMSREIFFVRR